MPTTDNRSWTLTKLQTFVGQVKSWVSGKVKNNLTTTTAGDMLDATQGKVLNDSITAVNTEATKVMTGATAQAAGAAGRVPAPAIADKKKFLCGDGTWKECDGGKLVVFELDTVTNSGGSYTHTTTLADVTHDMKAVLIETDDPSVFGATIQVTTADGSITLSCDEVNGTADVTVSCMFVANADPLTSSEFDILANRIGSLSALTTTDKSSLVGAVNELNASMIHSKKMTSSEFTYLSNGSRYKFNDQTFAARIISAFAIATSGFYTCTIRLDDAPDYYVICFYQGGSIMSSFPSDMIVLYI